MDSKLSRLEGLRPERELIILCSRARLDDATTNRIRDVLRVPLNWSEVLDVASSQHVEPLVCEALRLAGNDFVPAAVLESLLEASRNSAGLAVLYFAELLRICELFEAQGVPLVPYKGPVLSWLAFGNLARRNFQDLDFFVPQECMSRAAELLECTGYQGKFEKLDAGTDRVSVVPGQYGFYREATETLVELHTERTLRYFPVPLDFAKMQQRLIEVEISGRRIRTFSIEDTLVMLCVHGAKHFWNRLSWIVDVSELVAAQPVDWQLSMRIAAKLKSERLFLLGLYLAHDVLNAPLPHFVMNRAQRDANVKWLAAKVERELAGGASSHTGVVPRAAFRIRSRDGVVDAVGHMLRLALQPTEDDRTGLRLPKVLAPLYGIVRPWKLIREYGVGFRPIAKPDSGRKPRN